MPVFNENENRTRKMEFGPRRIGALQKIVNIFSITLDTYPYIRGWVRRLEIEKKEELVGDKADPKT